MIYHIISDDVFFLSGASKILKSVVNESCIINNNINSTGWRKTRKMIGRISEQKLIIYLHCFRKRRRLLRLAAAHNLEVMVLTQFKNDGSNLKYNSSIISARCSKEDFLFCLLNSGPQLANKNGSFAANKIIRMLSTGISIPVLASKLGISQKTIYAIKNNTIRSLGLSTTKLHGLLLCRDILEMKSINFRCKSIRRQNHMRNEKAIAPA